VSLLESEDFKERGGMIQQHQEFPTSAIPRFAGGLHKKRGLKGKEYGEKFLQIVVVREEVCSSRLKRDPVEGELIGRELGK